MPDADGKLYFVLTVRGERGPSDRAGLQQMVASGEARYEDQVRNAFGRPLGTVREVIGTGRTASARPSAASARTKAPLSATASARTSPPRPAAVSSGRSSPGAMAAQPHRMAPPASRRARLPWLVLIVVILLAFVGVMAGMQSAAKPLPSPPVAPPPPRQAEPPIAPPAAAAPLLSAPAPLMSGNGVEARVSIGRVIASGENAGEGIANAFDGDKKSKWLFFLRDRPIGEQRMAWIWIEPLPAARRIAGYALTSANDFAIRDPLIWRLVGIAGDGTETEIDRREGERWGKRHERREFTLRDAAGHAAYRLDVLALRADGEAPDCIQLAEIELLPAR